MRIGGVILAGGAGRRMGGRDKAFLLLGGRSLAERALALLRPQVDRVAISSNAGADRLAPLGVPVLADKATAGDGGREGPVAGIVAALAWGRQQRLDIIATAPVDAPFLPGGWVARLLSAAPAGAAFASAGGRAHPTVAIWPVARRDEITAAFAAGERRLEAIARLIGSVPVAFDDPDGMAFLNLNTPDDLARAEAMLGGT